jgi:hypothetical protein
MPFINGRYHINPTMGHALEAAREAEAALLALQQKAGRNSQDDANSPADSDTPAPDDRAPIHRIEIDAAEVVPNSTGRAARGYVARVHRTCATTPATSFATMPASSPTASPETHVFADHGDLLSYLRDALAQKSS